MGAYAQEDASALGAEPDESSRPPPVAAPADVPADGGIELPNGPPEPAAPPPSAEPATQPETAELPPAAPETPAGFGNAGVLAMTKAGFTEGTILAAMAANPTSFDVRPSELVALKNEGVSESVIEAMLTAETVKKQTAALAAAKVDARAQPVQQITSDEFAKLSVMIEQLAARQEAAAATNREPDPPAAVDRTPHAWIDRAGERVEIAPTIAQVAFTDDRDSTRMKTLQGIGSKALAFANPALGGITSTIGNLFGSDTEHRSAVWALAGTTAMRELAAAPRLEIAFNNIPGVNPDAYHPTLVRLVPTMDNYRLVAAAKTEGAGTVARPSGPIIEELVDTTVTRVSRGQYRVQPATQLDPGQYALVLRPIQKKERRRDRKNASLGELLGGGTTQILYLTWDFAVPPR
ncbi:MAG TPA: hypothetical protein VFX89_04775 [Gammaproteobacteria bacterium]|nr:hypothetical protein [Gammaproteobacteria bacterium]